LHLEAIRRIQVSRVCQATSPSQRNRPPSWQRKGRSHRRLCFLLYLEIMSKLLIYQCRIRMLRRGHFTAWSKTPIPRPRLPLPCITIERLRRIPICLQAMENQCTDVRLKRLPIWLSKSVTNWRCEKRRCWWSFEEFRVHNVNVSRHRGNHRSLHFIAYVDSGSIYYAKMEYQSGFLILEMQNKKYKSGCQTRKYR